MEEHIKMDRKLRARWLRALRGGKYKQTREGFLLRTDDKGPRYCCLGVLAELRGASRKSLEGRAVDSHPKINKLFMASDREFLVDMNDDGWTFKRIAKWIEKHL